MTPYHKSGVSKLTETYPDFLSSAHSQIHPFFCRGCCHGGFTRKSGSDGVTSRESLTTERLEQLQAHMRREKEDARVRGK